MTRGNLKSPNPRNQSGISLVNSKFLSVSSMNTLLAILKVTDERRDVILAGGLNDRFLWNPPAHAPQLLNMLLWNCTEQFGEWHIWSVLYKRILVLEVSICMQILISCIFYIVCFAFIIFQCFTLGLDNI